MPPLCTVKPPAVTDRPPATTVSPADAKMTPEKVAPPAALTIPSPRTAKISTPLADPCKKSAHFLKLAQSPYILSACRINNQPHQRTLIKKYELLAVVADATRSNTAPEPYAVPVDCKYSTGALVAPEEDVEIVAPSPT